MLRWVLSHTDSSWRPMQVIKADFADRLGRVERGGWGRKRRRDSGDGGLKNGRASRCQLVGSRAPSSPALGAYTIVSAEPRCADRSLIVPPDP